MTKRLYRSKKEKILGGVCGGIAEYFDVDPTLVRLFWVLLFFAGGISLLAYIVAWIIIPEAPTGARPAESRPPARANGSDADQTKPNPVESAVGGETREGAGSEKTLDNSRQKTLGIILIVTGIYFLLDRLFPRWDLIHYWPTWLIILGLYLLYQGVRPAK